MRILVVNGPNLNLLGTREVALYGRLTLADIESEVTALAAELGGEVFFFQSNHEGALVDRIQAAADQFDGLIINPGGLTHSSVSLLDALLASGLPAVEVHLTNLARRESFRQQSVIAHGVIGRIEGLGGDGYLLALRYLAALAKKEDG